MSGCPVGWDPSWGAERGKKWGEVITLRLNLPGVTDGDSGSPVWVVAAATRKCIDAKTQNPQVFGCVVQRKWGGGLHGVGCGQPRTGPGCWAGVIVAEVLLTKKMTQSPRCSPCMHAMWCAGQVCPQQYHDALNT